MFSLLFVLLIYCAKINNKPKTIMKKLLTLFLAVSALAITTVSCSKNDDASTPKATIAGKWYYDTTLTTYNGQVNPVPLAYNYAQCSGKKSYLDFQPNGVLNEG